MNKIAATPTSAQQGSAPIESKAPGDSDSASSGSRLGNSVLDALKFIALTAFSLLAIGLGREAGLPFASVNAFLWLGCTAISALWLYSLLQQDFDSMRQLSSSVRSMMPANVGAFASVLILALVGPRFWDEWNLVSEHRRAVSKWQPDSYSVLILQDGRLDLGASSVLEPEGTYPRLRDYVAASWPAHRRVGMLQLDHATARLESGVSPSSIDLTYFGPAAVEPVYSTSIDSQLPRSLRRQDLRVLSTVSLSQKTSTPPGSGVLWKSEIEEESFARFVNGVSATYRSSRKDLMLGIRELLLASEIQPDFVAARLELANAIGVALTRGWYQDLASTTPFSNEESLPESIEAAIYTAYEGLLAGLESTPDDTFLWKAAGTVTQGFHAASSFLFDEATQERIRARSRLDRLASDAARRLGREWREDQETSPSSLAAGSAILLEFAVDLEPRNFGAWNNLISSARSNGDLNLARRAYENARSLIPDSPLPDVNFSVIEVVRGDYEAAEERLQEALALNSHVGAVHYNLACIDALRRDHVAAIDHLKQAFSYGDLNYDLLLVSDSDLSEIRSEYGNRLEQLVRPKEHIAANLESDWLRPVFGDL